jgi:hypothetical protein
MTQKSLNSVKEWGKYEKMLDDKYMFNDRQVYIAYLHTS